MERQTLADKAAEQIFELIQQGGYRVGDQLPTEAQLVRQVGVGRNTIREALRNLASRNIITIRQGAGCFLSDKQGVQNDPLGFALVVDSHRLTQELLQVRIMIEPEIAALAAQNATDTEVERLDALLQELRQLASQGMAFSDNDQQFHSLLAECTHNQVITRLLPVITQGVVVFSDEVRTTEFSNTVKSHSDLVEAIRAHQVAEAREVMLYHLLYNKQRFQAGE